MFDRVLYKTQAKAVLKGNWKSPLLVVAVTIALILLVSLPSMVNGNESQSSWLNLISYLLTMAISGILEISVTCFFLEFIRINGGVKFDTFISALNRWQDGILACLWMNLWIVLWSLLFFFPGIVKAYSYSMTFFIMAENPGIPVRRAMNISKAMTKGFKGDLFVLDISFIGWGILCGLTAGIGLLWLEPYVRTSKTYAYHAIKEQAISCGRLKESDFIA